MRLPWSWAGCAPLRTAGLKLSVSLLPPQPPFCTHTSEETTLFCFFSCQLLSFSRISVHSTISKVLDKWFRVLIKGDFDKPWALMNAVTRVRLLASGGAEGHWLAGPSDHHCDVVTLPQSAARNRAHTSCCCLVTQLCPTLWPLGLAWQAPLPMEFPRQEYWSGLPFPSPGDLPNPGIQPVSPAWQADSLPLRHLNFPEAQTSRAENEFGFNLLYFRL